MSEQAHESNNPAEAPVYPPHGQAPAPCAALLALEEPPTATATHLVYYSILKQEFRHAERPIPETTVPLGKGRRWSPDGATAICDCLNDLTLTGARARLTLLLQRLYGDTTPPDALNADPRRV